MRSLFSIFAVAIFFSQVQASQAQASQVQAGEPQWRVDEANRTVFLGNCPECLASSKIALHCPTADKIVQFEISALAQEQKSEKDINQISFDFWGREYVYDASLKPNHLNKKFFPQFELELDDPLFGALQKGSVVTVSYLESKAKLSLKNSKLSLAQFAKFCQEEPKAMLSAKIEIENDTKIAGKTIDNLHTNGIEKNAAQSLQAPKAPKAPQKTLEKYSHTVMSKIEAKPDANGYFWYTGNGKGTGSPKTLNFSKPNISNSSSHDTPLNAPILHAQCHDGSEQTIDVKLTTDFGKHKAGDTVNVDFIIGEETFSYNGQTIQLNETATGVKLSIPHSDLIWQNIAKSKHVTFGSRDAEIKTVSGIEGAPAIHEFLKACGQHS